MKEDAASYSSSTVVIAQPPTEIQSLFTELGDIKMDDKATKFQAAQAIKILLKKRGMAEEVRAENTQKQHTQMLIHVSG